MVFFSFFFRASHDCKPTCILVFHTALERGKEKKQTTDACSSSPLISGQLAVHICNVYVVCKPTCFFAFYSGPCVRPYMNEELEAQEGENVEFRFACKPGKLFWTSSITTRRLCCSSSSLSSLLWFWQLFAPSQPQATLVGSASTCALVSPPDHLRTP